MQSQDLVSDNSSPSNGNQGEGVQTAPSNDQPTEGNFGTVQESTPTLSTSTSVLQTVANVEQTQSLSSRGDVTEMEDRDQVDKLSTIVEASPEKPLTDQLGNQLKELTSHFQEIGPILNRLDQTMKEQKEQFEKLVASLGKLFVKLELVTPNDSRDGSRSGEQSMVSPFPSINSKSTSNRRTSSASNTLRPSSVQDSKLNKTKTPGLVKGQQPEQTSSKSKGLVSSMLEKFELKCLIPQCTSPQSPITSFPSGPSVIVTEPTSSTSKSVPSGSIPAGRPLARRTLSEGTNGFEMLYLDDSRQAYVYERRESLTDEEPLSFPPLGYMEHEEAAALNKAVATLNNREIWLIVSNDYIEYVRNITKEVHRSLGIGSSSGTGNLDSLQSAERPNVIASEGEIRTEGSETQQLSNGHAPENTSSKHEAETVPQAKKYEYQLPPGRIFTPSDEVPPDYMLDFTSDETTPTEDFGFTGTEGFPRELLAESLPVLRDSGGGEQSTVSAGLPPADGSGTEGIGERQGHMVSDQRDQRLPTDHLPEITMTLPPLDSVAYGLEIVEISRLPVELPTIPEELSPVSDISVRSTETTSSVPPVLEGDVVDSGKQNSDESD